MDVWLRMTASTRESKALAHNEFTALWITGYKNGQSPRPCPAVQSPASALGSLSSGALSSERARRIVPWTC